MATNTTSAPMEVEQPSNISNSIIPNDMKDTNNVNNDVRVDSAKDDIEDFIASLEDYSPTVSIKFI